MPTNINQNTDANLGTAVVSWTPPTASDNSGEVTLTSSRMPGDSFIIGATTVTYTATDPYSNQATSTFTVTVSGTCLSLIETRVHWVVTGSCYGKYYNISADR